MCVALVVRLTFRFFSCSSVSSSCPPPPHHPRPLRNPHNHPVVPIDSPKSAIRAPTSLFVYLDHSSAHLVRGFNNVRAHTPSRREAGGRRSIRGRTGRKSRRRTHTTRRKRRRRRRRVRGRRRRRVAGGVLRRMRALRWRQTDRSLWKSYQLALRTAHKKKNQRLQPKRKRANTHQRKRKCSHRAPPRLIALTQQYPSPSESNQAPPPW